MGFRPPGVEHCMTAVRITHVGGPTALIEVGDWRLLTSPTFDPPGRRYAFGWATGSVKLAGPAIAASDLGPIDSVLRTHDHYGDNLDPAGQALLPPVSLAIVAATPGTGGSSRSPPRRAKLAATARPPHLLRLRPGSGRRCQVPVAAVEDVAAPALASASWKTIPSWAVIGTEDRTITPDSKRFMAERASSIIEEAKASHVSMISCPNAVTKLIETAAEATT